MKNICFPTDFSDYSLQALPVAISIAKRFNADFHFVHVISPYFSEYLSEKELENYYKPVEQKVQKYKKIIEKEGIAKDKIHCQSLLFNISNEIKFYVEDHAIDLIVMSTHGYGGLKRAFLGSTTVNLIHELDCPILTINPHALENIESFQVNSIFIPIDFSDLSKSVVDLGCSLAEKFNANLSLIHVLNDVNHWTVYHDPEVLQGIYGTYDNVLKQAKENSLNDLKKIENDISKNHPNLKTTIDVLEGNPEEVLSSYCEKYPGRMLVMSTHGRHGIDRFLIGSVAERVLQMAPFPVLIFNPNAHKQSKNSERKAQSSTQE